MIRNHIFKQSNVVKYSTHGALKSTSMTHNQNSSNVSHSGLARKANMSLYDILFKVHYLGRVQELNQITVHQNRQI